MSNFIELADYIRAYNERNDTDDQFGPRHLELLADFCQKQNPNFLRDRWINYIFGHCGPNGGKVKPPAPVEVQPINPVFIAWRDETLRKIELGQIK